MLNIRRFRRTVLFAILCSSPVQIIEGGVFIFEDLDIFRQARHLQDFSMVLFQIRETEHALEFQRFLHDAQENGEADSVDKLDIGKIYDELFQSIVQKLFAHPFETRRSHVIDVSPGHQDGNTLLRGL
jgi:hypothetical protein